MNKFKAKIYWIPKELGGRVDIPFGSCYAPIVRIIDYPDPPNMGWSLVVENMKLLNEPHTTMAIVYYLASEAPQERLRDNVIFELYEGNHLVAKGNIISDGDSNDAN